jgi:hypothetical protein
MLTVPNRKKNREDLQVAIFFSFGKERRISLRPTRDTSSLSERHRERERERAREKYTSYLLALKVLLKRL